MACGRDARVGPPNAPVDLVASVTGNHVSLQWQAPTIGASPVSYTLAVRRSELGPIVAEMAMGSSRALSVPAPDGTYYVSVTASNTSGTSPPSTNVVVRVPQAPTLPSPPSNLTATVGGSTVTFGWDPPAGGVTGHVLVAGLTPAFTVPYVTMPIGPTPAFTVPGVPAGTYYVRVLAQNAAGLSGPSNEVTVTIAGVSVPAAPTLNPPTVAGATVTLSWIAGSGAAPSGYTLIARTSPAGAPVATASLTGQTATFAGVPRGTYYLQLTAWNSAGTSDPSPQVVVTVQ
jgi:predicted phage tail protein